MSNFFYWLIETAVKMDEKRALARAEREGPKIAA
jgi:hypothetical protein